jgi:hypothetical protein
MRHRFIAFTILSSSLVLTAAAMAEKSGGRGENRTLQGTPVFSSGSFSGAREAVTLPPFNAVVTQVSSSSLDTTSQLLSPPAGAYNAYTVTVDWSPISGGPWSNEALWAFTDSSNLSTVNTFYADPGIAPNSAPSDDPVTLSWSGIFDIDYNTSSGPLYMLMAQQFAGSSAGWNNVSVTLDNVALPPTVATSFSGDTTGDPQFNRPSSLTTLSTLGTAVPHEVIPFYVSASGDYDIETLQGFDGYPLLYSGSFSAANPLTNLEELLDVGFAGEPDGGTVTLAAGTQYFLVMTGFENSDFGVYSGTITNGRSVAGQAVLGIVPEPTSLLALAAFTLAGRRRGC